MVNSVGCDCYFVSIHAPWEGCDLTPVSFQIPFCVSIHAPWEGCDGNVYTIVSSGLRFQFTHPGKGATHASAVTYSKIISFNSRTLGRVRRRLTFWKVSIRAFQFTHPGKGATDCVQYRVA